jgi:hypothetical protein
VESSDIQYARSGGVSIAYQVFGNGPIDLAFVPLLFNLTFGWTHSTFAHLIERLTSRGSSRAMAIRGGHRSRNSAGAWHLYSVIDA